MASAAGEWSREQIDDYETLISTTDVELLKRAWRNEKAAPEILPFEEALIKRAKEQIQLMVLFLNLIILTLVVSRENLAKKKQSKTVIILGFRLPFGYTFNFLILFPILTDMSKYFLIWN